MSHYKAYLIALDGHHIKAVDLECVDDDEAKMRAEQMAAKRNVADRSPRLDTRITLRGRENHQRQNGGGAVRGLGMVQSACRPLSA